MILHIVRDDKFIDAAYRLFEEVYPGQNEFIQISDQSGLRYIREAPVRTLSSSAVRGKAFVGSLRKYDAVLIHCLDRAKIRLIDSAPEDIPFVWIGWGGDYYDLITGEDPRRLYLPLTTALFDEVESSRIPPLRNRISGAIRKFLFREADKREVVNRFRFFAPVLYEDYLLVKESLPDFRPDYIAWNSGTLEDDLIRDERLEISGNNILVGNSATYEGNHLDAFELLLSMDLKNRKIITPLSYGDTIYRERVIEYGKRRLGDGFIPLTDFLPIEDYINRIRSCSVVIMNHLRQQAVGNIIMMMYMGAKVFLNSKNPAYSFFKKKGAFIFDLDALKRDGSLMDSRLGSSEILANRQMIRMNWSRDTVRERTRKLVEAVVTPRESKIEQ